MNTTTIRLRNTSETWVLPCFCKWVQISLCLIRLDQTLSSLDEFILDHYFRVRRTNQSGAPTMPFRPDECFAAPNIATQCIVWWANPLTSRMFPPAPSELSPSSSPACLSRCLWPPPRRRGKWWMLSTEGGNARSNSWDSRSGDYT